MESADLLENGQVPQEDDHDNLLVDEDLEEEDDSATPAPERKIEPMEIAPAEDSSGNEDDMESLLGSSGANGQRRPSSKQMERSEKTYLNGWIRPQKIGNMHILFPEYYHKSSWGVMGPHWFGPACVWLILCVATHFCLRRAHHLGTGSVLICYIFFTASTFLLTDVSLRDPGICLDKEIPETTPSAEASQWRWCDFCHVYQPPDGAHCPDCNVCIAGYDHHCVWMGTCIGKKNYRPFLKFNISWLYYVCYAIFWLAVFGPVFKGTH